MNTPLHRIALVALMASALWPSAGCEPQDQKSETSRILLPVEPPDLGEMGEGVQKQYRRLRRTLTELLESGQFSDQEPADAWGSLGMWHHTYAYPETGLYCYQQAETLAPKDGRWPYFQARILQLDGEFAAARAKYRAVLDLEPERPGPSLRLAELELDTRNPDKAEELYSQILDQNPGSAPAQFGLGRIAFQRGETEKAVELLEAALLQHPQATRLHYHLAMAYRELGELDRAEHHLSQVPETNRHQLPLPLGELWDRELNLMDRGPGAFRQRAMQARRLNNEGLATELFGRALAADPRNVEMKIAYTRSLDRIGKSAAAIELLEEALDSDPDHAGLNVLFGTILAQRGDRRRAEEHLRTAVRIDSECLRCRRSLAVLLRSEARDEEALEHLQFLRANNVSASTSFSLAVVLIGLGREQEALLSLEEDRRLLPEDDSLRLLAARLMAASSIPDLRNPQRANDLVSQGSTTTLMGAETKAMVEAAAERFGNAVAWQRASMNAANEQPKQILHRTRRRLDLYENGRKCLVPWERGERNLLVPVSPPTLLSPPAT